MALPWEIAEKKFSETHKKILAMEEAGLNLHRIAHALGIPVSAVRKEREAISRIWREADRECGLEP